MKNVMETILLLLLVFPLSAPGQHNKVRPVSEPFRGTRFTKDNSVPVTITTPGNDNALTFLSQDFEGSAFPPAGWTNEGSGSAFWTRSTDASGYGVGIGSSLADFYSISSGSQFSLITAVFLAAVAGDSVKFDHAYATYTTENDQLQISTSTNGGTSWTILVTLAGGVSGPLVTAPPTASVFVPTASQWATKRYTLPVGTNRVKFTGISAFGNELYVDNIQVGTPYPNDASVSSIDAPNASNAPGTYQPKATVKNYGTLPQSFATTFTITPGGYTSTQNVTNLAPGATQQLTFADWSPTIGSYASTAVSQLGSDQNRQNDTLTGFHIISDITRSVLLEFCTGAWCQWCPCGDSTAAQLQRAHPNLVVLAYHGPAGSSNDPYSTYNGNNILSLMGFSGYPTANLDRQNTPGDFTTWTDYCTNRYTSNGYTPVSITIQSKTYNPATRQLNVTLALTTNCTLPAQYKVSYVITEDNLLYTQTGNGTCPGSSTWIHNWVVRNMVNGATGENVNTGTWTAGQTVTKTFSTTLNSAWVAANCKLDVFVYEDNPALGAAEIQNAIVTPVIPEPTMYAVANGWNMVSVPLTVVDYRRTIVFPSATSSAFAFSQNLGYVVHDTLSNGVGYWLKFPTSQNVGITGTVRVRDTVHVNTGWNLIGSISSPALKDSILQLPSGIVGSSYFGYSGGYSPADTLQPGRGYWVNVTQNGRLVLR